MVKIPTVNPFKTTKTKPTCAAFNKNSHQQALTKTQIFPQIKG